MYGGERKRLQRDLPVHCKSVTDARLDVLNGFAEKCRHPEIGQWWKDASRFVFDPTRYREYLAYLETHPSVEAQKTKMDLHFAEQIAMGRFIELSPSERPLDWIVHFGHPEHLGTEKARQRAIKWTRSLNDFYRSSALVGVPLPSREEQRRQAVRDGGRPLFAITLDASAFFDAFVLHPKVSLLQCVKWRGKVYRSARMSMGQRTSVDVAQACALLLADFDVGNVETQCNVDNFRLVGPDVDELVRVAAELVRRTVLEANITLNEIPAEIAADEVALLAALRDLVTQKGDWLGCTYDYSAHTVRVADKSVKKLRHCWERSRTEGWTVHDFLVHMGLLFFFTSVLDLNLSPYFDLMRAYSQLARRLQASGKNDPIWRSPIQFVPSVARQLERWTETALKNEALDLTALSKAPRYMLFVDASGAGWGAIYFDARRGTFLTHLAKWAPSEAAAMQHSTHAEPEAAARAIARFVTPNRSDQMEPTLVLSDSTTAVAMIENRRSPSYVVNLIAARLAPFPRGQLLAQHIPGVSHPCDWMSRADTKAAEEITSGSLRQVMGQGKVFTGAVLERPRRAP